MILAGPFAEIVNPATGRRVREAWPREAFDAVPRVVWLDPAERPDPAEARGGPYTGVAWYASAPQGPAGEVLVMRLLARRATGRGVPRGALETAMPTGGRFVFLRVRPRPGGEPPLLLSDPRAEPGARVSLAEYTGVVAPLVARLADAVGAPPAARAARANPAPDAPLREIVIVRGADVDRELWWFDPATGAGYSLNIDNPAPSWPTYTVAVERVRLGPRTAEEGLGPVDRNTGRLARLAIRDSYDAMLARLHRADGALEVAGTELRQAGPALYLQAQRMLERARELGWVARGPSGQLVMTNPAAPARRARPNPRGVPGWSEWPATWLVRPLNGLGGATLVLVNTARRRGSGVREGTFVEVHPALVWRSLPHLRVGGAALATGWAYRLPAHGDKDNPRGWVFGVDEDPRGREWKAWVVDGTLEWPRDRGAPRLPAALEPLVDRVVEFLGRDPAPGEYTVPR